MDRAEDEVRHSTAIQVAITDELQVAARKLGATRREEKSLDAANPQTACETLQNLGARFDLLGIVSRIGDSASDEDVLKMLREWNTLNVIGAKYLVEIINAGKTEHRMTVEAATPIRAATGAAGGDVRYRTSEDVWIRVTPVGTQQSYQFVKA